MLAGVGCLLLLLVIASNANRGDVTPPNPTPRQVVDTERTPSTPQTPATIHDVQNALDATDRAIADRSWERAEAHAKTVREQWLSYRTPMQAGGGQRMWSTDVMQRFQSSLNGLITDIAQRDAEGARAKIRGMQEILDMYDDQTDRRLETTPKADTN